MSLCKYYKYAVIIPSALAIGSYLLYTFIDLTFGPKYDSEWINANSIAALAVFVMIINSIAISLLSLTLFFNNYSRVRRNFLFSAASWFLLPMIWMSFTLYHQETDLNKASELLEEQNIYTLFNVVPYSLGLILTFIRFRTQLQADNTGKKRAAPIK